MTKLTASERRKRAHSTEPKIEVNQFWVAYLDDGSIGRRIRILASHPDGGWIYQEHPSKLRKHDLMGVDGPCPEFNLRYVFELETT